jgi:hypothetical protein
VGIVITVKYVLKPVYQLFVLSVLEELQFTSDQEEEVDYLGVSLRCVFGCHGSTLHDRALVVRIILMHFSQDL